VRVEGGCCPCRALTLFGREIIGNIRRVIPIIRPVRAGESKALQSGGTSRRELVFDRRKAPLCNLIPACYHPEYEFN
jgi:hypothetical protein